MLRVGAVAVLVFLARAAGTGVVAADLAPGGGILRINRLLGRLAWRRLGQEEAFADIVYKAGYASPIRTPRGEDLMAACGQLKSATERERKNRAQIRSEAGLA